MFNSTILDPAYIESILQSVKKELNKSLKNQNTQTNSNDGFFCKKCNTYSEYAEPNQEDKSFICYSCRNY